MVNDQEIKDDPNVKRGGDRVAADKDAFARRLYRLMLDNNLTQSDLARKAGIERNRISSYVRGISLPTGLYLKKVADALGVKPTDLLPDERLAPAKAAYAMTVSADGKNMRLTANVRLPTTVGAQIVALLTEHATTDGE